MSVVESVDSAEMRSMEEKARRMIVASDKVGL